ncbi:hypothetical protein A4A49_44569 [Nicotiana attenuata]|uniref:Uncharacterized protein n=1 Tax=Nicotiana attenuata TaxID=49451 RepID=A0A1J6JGV7_NICAT|nr:hypothetical protein A4A49_44569 [Nicotiana attenuata]
MATAPSFTGGKPPDHPQNVRLLKANPTQQVSSKNNTPAGTDLHFGEAITVQKNRLGASNISQSNSVSKLEIPNRGDNSSSSGAPPHQILGNSTVEIVSSGEQKISGGAKMQAQGATDIQIKKGRYQNFCLDEKNTMAPSISHGYQSDASIYQIKETDFPAGQGVRRNANTNFGPVGQQFLIGNPSKTSKEHTGKDSDQFTKENDRDHQVASSDLRHLAGHGAPGIIGLHNQYQSVPLSQVSVSNAVAPILHGPIFSNIQKTTSEHCSFNSVRPIVNTQFRPIRRSLSTGDMSLACKDPTHQVSSQSNLGNGSLFLAKSPVSGELADHHVPGIIEHQNQCHSIPAPQVIDSNPSSQILHDPKCSNIKNAEQEHCSSASVRPNANQSFTSIPPNFMIGTHSIPSKDDICQGSAQEDTKLGHAEYPKSPDVPQFTSDGATAVLGSVLHPPNVQPKHQVTLPPQSKSPSQSPPAVVPDQADPASDVAVHNTPNHNPPKPDQNQKNPPFPNTLKISSNFEKPNIPKTQKKTKPISLKKLCNLLQIPQLPPPILSQTPIITKPNSLSILHHLLPQSPTLMSQD